MVITKYSLPFLKIQQKPEQGRISILVIAPGLMTGIHGWQLIQPISMLYGSPGEIIAGRFS